MREGETVIKRLAFVHLMRTGGTYINRLMQAYFAPEEFHESWLNGLKRDWTLSELEARAKLPGNVYVHNHVRNWTHGLVQLFKAEGFYTFCLLREPGDQLCSLYFWLTAVHEVSGMTLNDFIHLQLAGGEYLWCRS